MLALLAAIPRIVWCAFVRPDPTDGRFDDTGWYRGAAHYLARGEGYLNPFSGTPTAGWPPGYPATLGATFKLFGEGIWQTQALNIAAAVLTVLVVYAIGCLMFDRRTAFIAAAALAVWPGQVYFSSLGLSEPLFTLLFTAGIWLMLLAPVTSGGWRAIVLLTFGFVLGLATLTRGQALLLLPVGVAFWCIAGIRWRPAIAWGILSALVVIVVLAPWVARNERQLGSPVIIATNVGANVWLGHHEGSTGRMQTSAEVPLPDRAGLTQPEYEVEGNDLLHRKGLRFMVTHPADEGRLSAIKVRAMYESDATALDWNAAYEDGFYATDSLEWALRRFANVWWFTAIALSGIGLLAARARFAGPVGLLPLLVGVWTLTHLLFFGDSRFHYPIVFVFALLGARGAVAMYEVLRRPQPGIDSRYAPA